MRRTLFLSALATTAALGTGCYKYEPIAQTERDPGIRVRATLNDRGTADLARFLGPSVAEVEGNIVSSQDGEMVLAVASTQQHSGIENFWNGEQVAVPRDFVVSLRERKFSTLRTTLLVGGILAGGIILNASLGDALGLGIGGGKGGGGGGSQQ